MGYPADSGVPAIEEGSWRPQIDVIARVEGVSATAYRDGSVVVSHSRMDHTTRRFIFTRLADQTWDGSERLGVILALIAGACELYEDFCGETGYPN